MGLLMGLLMSLWLSTGVMAAQAVETGTDALLPAESYADEVPKPEATLGWPVGAWHARPEQIDQYFRQLAAASERMSLTEIGRTHEQRPLLRAVITSAANQANLETLREQHLQGEGPLVVWLGYSIHGNEASGSNASMLTAYHLAAGEADWISDLLDSTIVIIDPMMNPDGLGRFATWANMHHGQETVPDRLHRAHWEAWPSGRFNHYWFDLNRDWLPATQPESVARLKLFHQWRPHVLGDFHEQGPDRGYFFQPGVPDRNNPLTPAENFALTAELARYHARALDQVGQPYYTRESFDDFYYGKGSTYPDINGSIGILFEQPSARGNATESIHGEFSFQQGIRNQYLTSISTLRGAHALRQRLIAYQNDFFAGTTERARGQSTRAWVFGDGDSPGRTRQLVDLLRLHQIDVRPLDETVEAGGQAFTPGSAWVVSTRQRQAGLIEAMFEQRTEFDSNVFYDVSAWTLPLASNLPFAALDYLPDTADDPTPASHTFVASDSALAYRLPADRRAAHAAVLDLLADGYTVSRAGINRLATNEQANHRTGHYLIPLRDAEQRSELMDRLAVLSQQYDVAFEAIGSGLNPGGADLGSPSVVPLKLPKPLLLVGQGLNPMEAGHIWHLLDRRLGLPTAMLDIRHPQPPNLAKYTHLLIPGGLPMAMPEAWLETLRGWVKNGGVLVTQKDSARWAEALFAPETSTPAEDDPAPAADQDPVQQAIAALAEQRDTSAQTLGRQSYDGYQDQAADRVVGGAIFTAAVDPSHPLLMGYGRDTLPVFVNSITRLKPSINAYSTPMVFASSEPVAGFTSEVAAEQLKDAPLLVADRVGNGLVIKFAFNPNFRAFWYGTEGLYINALLNSGLVTDTRLPALTP